MRINPFMDFYHGTSDAYKYMGCHKVGDNLYKFVLWAPNAKKVYVAGDFNGWKYGKNRMKKVDGLWMATVEAKEYDEYKYVIVTKYNRLTYKADPYATMSRTRGQTNSVICDQAKRYEWGDGEWIDKMKQTNVYSSPINIYEVHLGSWKRHEDGSNLTYRELAEQLPQYAVQMGYTHLEFLPLNEHPLDDSWGYQATGYFSPTNRYGAPCDLKYLIDVCHKCGLGVIMDYVPAHFCKDEFGLIDFDGTHCYEYDDPLKMEHASWGTRVFDFGKGEVISFLLSAAKYWLEEYHFDGIRVDAVASMLYLDYDRKEWRSNVYGGKENLEAMAFLRRLSVELFAYCPYLLLIAEESTAFSGVTAPADCGGLGFNFKWNMGWMNDVLTYVSAPFDKRGDLHDKMTFSMVYAYTENFILPFSHDEVVHCKQSIIGKLPGKYNEKFDGLRALLMYMFAHPGKKLTFMGTEIAQFDEWNFADSVEWHLLKYPSHDGFHRFVAQLNAFYLAHPEFYHLDCSGNGFCWKVVTDRSDIFAFERYDGNGNAVLCLFNMNVWGRDNYCVENLTDTEYTLAFNSDILDYGGKGCPVNQTVHVDKGRGLFNLPPLSAQYYLRKRP